ncbi:L-fucose:H+ symporter permease [Parvularcula flava]|uniref:L-fucose:H+ symporter permease n=2 Tax=Aquisalinus luteolus TaxID=1566827 RepID=A0ABX0HEN3_9PROT|nr:L-fucose:H+ symporter permease [Aquisalinus luteolus]
MFDGRFHIWFHLVTINKTSDGIRARKTMTSPESGGKARYLWPLVLIISLFFLWGIANNLNDVLIAQFKKAFSLTDLQSGLVQSAFYFGYFVFAIPAAVFMKRFGYKAAVIFGLIVYGAGALLFLPAAEVQKYELFLGALFVIASGLAFLETSANPLIAAMGPEETSERRLNFAQSFNPLGAISGVLIGRQFILSGIEPTEAEFAAMTPEQVNAFYEAEAQAVQMPYLVLGLIVLVWAAVIFFTKFPPVASAQAARGEGPGKASDFLALFSRPAYMFGVIAQFAYVGAQVCIWSYMIRYGQYTVDGMGEKTAAAYLTWSLVAFMIGRFIATALMGIIKPAQLMALFAIINVGLCLVAVLLPGQTGLYAMAATSFFMSLMFPTIFAMSLRNLGALKKAGSSFLIMAIIGGAVLTALMGYISDLTSIATAMLVPTACFVVILVYSLSRAGAMDSPISSEAAPTNTSAP